VLGAQEKKEQEGRLFLLACSKGPKVEIESGVWFLLGTRVQLASCCWVREEKLLKSGKFSANFASFSIAFSQTFFPSQNCAQNCAQKCAQNCAQKVGEKSTKKPSEKAKQEDCAKKEPRAPKEPTAHSLRPHFQRAQTFARCFPPFCFPPFALVQKLCLLGRARMGRKWWQT